MSRERERGGGPPAARARLGARFQSRLAIQLARAKDTSGGSLQAGLDAGSAAVHAGQRASDVVGHVAMDVASHAHHVMAEADKAKTTLVRQLARQATVQMHTESWSVSTVYDNKTYVPEESPGDNNETSFENLINALGGKTAVDNMKSGVSMPSVTV